MEGFFDFKVTFDNLLTFVGLIFVGLQMRDGNRQQKLGSQIRLQSDNRELISMGFSNPVLFAVLKDGKNIDPDVETYYLQLWLNQFSQFHALCRTGGFEKDVRESLELDFRDMMRMENMRRHWAKLGQFYPVSFRDTVNRILAETGSEQDLEARRKA